MQISALYVIQWSSEQETFRVQKMTEFLEGNWDVYYHRSPPNPDRWHVVAFVDNPAEVEGILRRLKDGLDIPFPE